MEQAPGAGLARTDGLGYNPCIRTNDMFNRYQNLNVTPFIRAAKVAAWPGVIMSCHRATKRGLATGRGWGGIVRT